MSRKVLGRILWIIACFAGWIALCTSCSDQHAARQTHVRQWMQGNDKIKVLATTEMVGDLVKEVGGSHVDVLVLIQGQLDPHSYQLIKGDDEKLSFARLIFYNGLGLEHGPSLHRYLVQNDEAHSLGDYLKQRYPESMIDVEGERDPHIWMDISLWAKTVPYLVQVLSQHDPAHAADYESNGRRLRNEMEQRHQQVKEVLHQLPERQRYLVTSHDAFNYFARAYLAEEGETESGEWRNRAVAPEGLAPESQLSAANIHEIIQHVKRYGIRFLFPESNVSRDSIKKIVQAGRDWGLNIDIASSALYGDAMGPPGSQADTYLGMMLYNANVLAAHMGEALPLDSTGRVGAGP